MTDAELEPGWTEYGKRVPYATYDVTALLAAGGAENVLGVALGRGWYASAGGGEPTNVARTLIAKLVVDGETVLATRGGAAGGWVCGQGPIVYDSVYNGETYDARLARAVDGWDLPGFNAADGHWRPAARNTDPPKGALVSPKMPPVRRVEALTPVAIAQPQPGVFVVDFGQNIAGRVRLTLPRAGRGNVTMRHAEVLQHEGIVAADALQPGMLYVDNLRAARATDTYVYDDSSSSVRDGGAGGTVEWEPAFTYHGFRYLEVRGHEPKLSEAVAWVMQTDVAEVGALDFSDDLLNRIHRAIHWGQRANVMSVPTVRRWGVVRVWLVYMRAMQSARHSRVYTPVANRTAPSATSARAGWATHSSRGRRLWPISTWSPRSSNSCTTSSTRRCVRARVRPTNAWGWSGDR